jgi:hypothetical protein
MKTLQYATLTFIAIFVFDGIASAQSPVDLARRERQRQDGAESKTILNRDSPHGASAETKAPTLTPAAPKTAAVAAPTDNRPKDNKGRDEKYWRSAFEKARVELRRAEDRSAVVDLAMNDLNAQLLREGVYTREMELRAELDKAQKMQVIVRKELADAQQRLRDLEDELRRSGGLPGWAR